MRREAAMKMVLVLALWSLALALSATAQDDTAAIMKQINCGSFTPVSVPIGFQVCSFLYRPRKS